MELKRGYKQTAVGLIPQDWEVQKVGDICGFIVPGRNKPRKFEGDIPWITTPDLEDGRSVTKSRNDLYVSRDEAKNVGSKIVPAGSILMSCAGELGIVAFTEREIVINQQLHAFIPSATIDGRYLLNAIRAQTKHIDALATKTAVPYLNKYNCNSIPIALPPLPEQHAIATALSDVDALIKSLDELIAKKRDLKQAAIQQLLSGKKRLRGFTGQWEVKTLGDLFDFSGGYSASRDQLSSNGHCYLHYGDIHKSSKTFIDVRAEYQDIPKLNIPLKRISPESLLDDGDVAFVDASEDDKGTSRHIVVVNKDRTPYIAGLHTIVAKSKTAELAHKYRRYCFQTAAIRQQFLFYAVGTKVSGISKTNIAKLTLPVPSLPEQTAIAAVLSDMDADIAALEARRDKTRALKQGMMQELLTGKTRLV